jgi:hypothetical protein
VAGATVMRITHPLARGLGGIPDWERPKFCGWGALSVKGGVARGRGGSTGAIIPYPGGTGGHGEGLDGRV